MDQVNAGFLQEQAASASSSSSSQSNRGKRSSGANSNQRFGEYGAMTAALQGQLEHVFRTQLVSFFEANDPRNPLIPIIKEIQDLKAQLEDLKKDFKKVRQTAKSTKLPNQDMIEVHLHRVYAEIRVPYITDPVLSKVKDRLKGLGVSDKITQSNTFRKFCINKFNSWRSEEARTICKPRTTKLVRASLLSRVKAAFYPHTKSYSVSRQQLERAALLITASKQPKGLSRELQNVLSSGQNTWDRFKKASAAFCNNEDMWQDLVDANFQGDVFERAEDPNRPSDLDGGEEKEDLEDQDDDDDDEDEIREDGE